MRKSNNNESAYSSQDVYLTRNLTFNSKCYKLKPVSEYFLHTMSNSLSKSEMKQHMINFKKDNKNPHDSDKLTVINKVDKRKYISDYTDKDFYINLLICVFCRREFKSFISLFHHLTVSHPDYDFYYEVSENQHGLPEGHIYALETPHNYISLDDEVKDYTFILDKCQQQLNLINTIKESDISFQCKENEKKVNNKKKGQKKNEEKKKNVKMYPQSDDKIIFFHSVTGQILNEDSEDSDYEIDNDDLREFEERDIDKFLDVCDSDKTFFKLWNKFIHTEEICKVKNISNMPKIIEEFLNKNYGIIEEKKLHENFHLHLINLFDYKQINKEDFINAVNLLSQLIEMNFNNY